MAEILYPITLGAGSWLQAIGYGVVSRVGIGGGEFKLLEGVCERSTETSKISVEKPSEGMYQVY